MNQLEQARQQIDSADKQIAALFEARMEAAAAIAQYKQANGLPVLDATREKAVIEKNLARLQSQTLAPLYEDFLQHLMGLSRQYQTQILGKGTAAYQGVEGGFGHEVMHSLFPHSKAVACPTFAAVFEAVEKGEAAFGVVPFENSNTGDVAGVLDLCYNHNCFVTAMYDLPVSQNLLGQPGATLADVRKVYSKAEALDQSKRFLEGLSIELVPYANTATAAKYVAESGDKSLAAVASLQAGELYGLIPLVKNISTEDDNTTRFIIITKEEPAQGDLFSLLVSVENQVGTLAKVIETITAEGFNMECIKSRPMHKRPWEYYFYIELVGAQAATKTEALLQKLDSVCLSARLLGRYNRISGGSAL